MIPKPVTVDYRRVVGGWTAGYDAGGRLCELTQTGPGGSFFRLQSGRWIILVEYDQQYVETVAGKLGVELRSSFRTGDESVGLAITPSPIAPETDPKPRRELPKKGGM